MRHRLHGCHFSSVVVVRSGVAGLAAAAADAPPAPQRRSAARRRARGAARAARSGRSRCAGPGPRARSASGRRAPARPGPRPARTRPDRVRRRTRAHDQAPGPQADALAVGGVARVEQSAVPTASSSTPANGMTSVAPREPEQRRRWRATSSAERGVERQQLARRRASSCACSSHWTDPSAAPDSCPNRSGRPGGGAGPKA